VRANLAALRARTPGHPALARYDEIARLLTGRSDARADEGAAWLEALVRRLAVPSLSAFGLTGEAIPGLVEMGRRASSMKANPIALTADELTRVLEAAS
jgi:alcohol dehydrogenase class IV